MGMSKKQLILYSAQEDNILPLTSACNVKCIFCSHRQNPKGVQTYGIGHRSLEEIELTLEFIDPNRKIVIGESVTRIMEGEPFLHPKIREILQVIREKYPETPVQITTNGTLLTDEILDLIQSLGGIELYISLNSVTLKGRELLMGTKGEQALEAIPQLQNRGISFQGSVVAMPWIVGWDDLKETVAFFDQHNAETVRIFMPGYTKKAPQELQFAVSLREELVVRVAEWKQDYLTPLVVEPAFVKDLHPEVVGVIQDSSAERAGFLEKDQILKIGYQEPFSRVDAFLQLMKGGRQMVQVVRKGELVNLTLDKVEKAKSGLVFAYDLHPAIYDQVYKVILRHQAQRTLLMTSTLAAPLIEHLAQKLNAELGERARVETVAVPNRFFGGSIIAGGLLVIQDFLDQWEELKNRQYDLVLLPDIFLDPWGVDLVGRESVELEEAIDAKIEFIEI